MKMLIIALALVLTGCGKEEPPPPVPIEYVTFTGTVFKTEAASCFTCRDKTYLKEADGKVHTIQGIHGEVGDTLTLTIWRDDFPGWWYVKQEEE